MQILSSDQKIYKIIINIYIAPSEVEVEVAVTELYTAIKVEFLHTCVHCTLHASFTLQNLGISGFVKTTVFFTEL